MLQNKDMEHFCPLFFLRNICDGCPMRLVWWQVLELQWSPSLCLSSWYSSLTFVSKSVFLGYIQKKLHFFLENRSEALARCFTFLENQSIHQKLVGLIPGQGTYLGCRFHPWLRHVQEATDQCYLSHINLFLSLSPPPHTSFSLSKINKHMSFIHKNINSLKEIFSLFFPVVTYYIWVGRHRQIVQFRIWVHRECQRANIFYYFLFTFQICLSFMLTTIFLDFDSFWFFWKLSFVTNYQK